MKLQLKNTPEQVELIKAMGSRNQTVSREAQEAFAAFIGPVIQRVLQVAGTASSIYSDAPFNQDDSASYPLDLYYNENNTGYISVRQLFYVLTNLGEQLQEHDVTCMIDAAKKDRNIYKKGLIDYEKFVKFVL